MRAPSAGVNNSVAVVVLNVLHGEDKDHPMTGTDSERSVAWLPQAT